MLIGDFIENLFCLETEAHSEHSKMPKMELFKKIFNGIKPQLVSLKVPCLMFDWVLLKPL